MPDVTQVAPLVRRSDWHQRLTDYIMAAMQAPYQPGVHDCALFAAGAVDAMTGTDLAAPYRGRYATLRGGVRVLRRCGFANHVALVRHHLTAVPVARAMPGDLAWFDADELPVLGVVQGGVVYVLLPGGGLGWRPLTDATEAFAL